MVPGRGRPSRGAVVGGAEPQRRWRHRNFGETRELTQAVHPDWVISKARTATNCGTATAPEQCGAPPPGRLPRVRGAMPDYQILVPPPRRHRRLWTALIVGLVVL